MTASSNFVINSNDYLVTELIKIMSKAENYWSRFEIRFLLNEMLNKEKLEKLH